MTTETDFAEALEGYTARLGTPKREDRVALWERPDGLLRLIEWRVYGFVELAAFRSDAQASWFLSEPTSAFVSLFGPHPLVDAGRAVVEACAWLEDRAVSSRGGHRGTASG